VKKRMTGINATSRLAFRTAIVGLVLLGMAFRSSAGETVIPPSDPPFGLSYEEWPAKWWQYYLGQDTKKLELVGKPDNCEGPASRVRFLEGTSASVTSTNPLTIHTDNPLFFAGLGFNKGELFFLKKHSPPTCPKFHMDW
jgi:hypothetical protein